MATIPFVVSPKPMPGDVKGYTVSWPSMHNGDVGQAIDLLGDADRSIQIEGIFGAGGTIQIRGSNDGTTFRTCHDPLGNLLSFTAAAMTHLMEIPWQLRPEVTGGDGSTSLTVTIFMRRTPAQ